MNRTFSGLKLPRPTALALLALALVAVFVAGCSSTPAQKPEAFLKDFMSMHITMLDTAVADYYVSSEKKIVVQQVNDSIALKTEQGTLDSIKGSKLDLSRLSYKVLDQKEAYVDDQDHFYVKVKVTGTYNIKYGDVSKDVDENETFILRADGSRWKITETENPWS